MTLAEGESWMICCTDMVHSQKETRPPSRAAPPLYAYSRNGEEAVASALVGECGSESGRGRDGGSKKQNVKAGSFSVRCVTINSDTLNNSVSDIESAACQQPCPCTSSPPGGRSHYKKNNQSGLMELISSGL